ncbi:MAG TPA: sulfatase [Planctomycetaceae bacterium]|nr:sulfatase [Planctomycetaceae bacterium]
MAATLMSAVTRSLAIAVAINASVSLATAAAPSVLLIVVDDLGYGDLGCYGATDIATPQLDRLASRGTRFTQFCVAQPVCTASRAALLTGCYPNRLGMSGALNHTSKVGIHPDETLLPELFHQAGYATAIFGKWHLGHQPPFLPTRRGFDEFQGLPYSNDNGPLHPVIRDIPPLPFYRNEKVAETDPDQSQFTRRFTDAAIDFIGRHREKPFFVYLPHVMPHVPIFASTKFKGTSQRGLYGDVVQELDASIGELMAKLDEWKLAENTLVLFLSDNGPFLSYGTHAGSAGPFREGKLTTFEGGVRVPFMAVWDGKIPAGQTCDQLITGLDILPTLAKVCGLKSPTKKIDGMDLSRVLWDPQSASGRQDFVYYSGTELHALRRGKWKLHVPHDYLTVDGPPGTNGKPANYANMKPRGIEESGIRGIASRHGYRVESLPLSLFDLEADPGEQTNVADAHPDTVRQLSELVEIIRTDLGDSLQKRAGTGIRPVGQVP